MYTILFHTYIGKFILFLIKLTIKNNYRKQCITMGITILLNQLSMQPRRLKYALDGLRYRSKEM